MKKMFQQNKILFIFPILLAVTLMFLEIPKRYYRFADQQLFKESEIFEYETRVVKTLDDFEDKVKFLKNYSEDTTVGYSELLTQEETRESLVDEIATLYRWSTKKYSKIYEEIWDDKGEWRGFTARIIHSIGNEQCTWEVGYLEFYCWNLGMWGMIVYDTSSNNIFTAEIYYDPGCDVAFDEVEKEVLYADYEGIPPEEIEIAMEKEGYLLLSLFSEKDNDWMKQLEELRDYYWGVSMEIEY